MLSYLSKMGKPSGHAPCLGLSMSISDIEELRVNAGIRWRLFSTMLGFLNPGQAVQQTLTTGRYKDSMDRLMLGVAVGFRLGKGSNAKMAAQP